MYWYPYYPPYIVFPYDPIALMYSVMQWLWYPYYVALTLEIYRITLESIRKAMEMLTKSMESMYAK